MVSAWVLAVILSSTGGQEGRAATTLMSGLAKAPDPPHGYSLGGPVGYEGLELRDQDVEGKNAQDHDTDSRDTGRKAAERKDTERRETEPQDTGRQAAGGDDTEGHDIAGAEGSKDAARSDSLLKEPPEPQGEAAAERRQAGARPEARAREILDALSRELSGLQAPLSALSMRIVRLREALRSPWGEVPEARERDLRGYEDAPSWLEGEDARLYGRLIERQERLLERWRRLGAWSEAPAEVEDSEREARRSLREELRAVLLGILDLRERGRELQLRRLERELEALRRELDIRRDEKVRRSMVEERIRYLLEGGQR